MPTTLTAVVASDGRSPDLMEVLKVLVCDDAVGDVILVANGGWVSRLSEFEFPSMIRIVTSDEGNLSSARNLGLEKARSELVAFVDDDAIPQPGWGSGYLECFSQSSSIGAAGGAARLPPSDHLSLPYSRTVAGCFALVEVEKTERCEWLEFPYGCNFAVRRSAALDVGGFRHDLGYGDGALVPHEETELFIRLHHQSWEIWWEKASPVEHRVALSKRNFQYLVRRAFAQGRGDVRLTRLHPECRLLPGRLDSVRSVGWLLRGIGSIVWNSREMAVDHVLRAAKLAGRVREASSLR